MGPVTVIERNPEARRLVQAFMPTSCTLWLTLSLGLAAAAAPLAQQPRQFALNTAGGVTAHGVVVTPDTLQGKPGLKVVASPDAMRQDSAETLATLNGVEFGNGTIEAEIAGVPAPDAPEGARGFVGIAFRVQPDLRTYDAFYLRPTNGRADDQERRNHSAQYISHPDWPWFRLRKETPSKYESYVDRAAGRLDEDPHRGARRSRAAVRQRSTAADTHRQRREDRRQREGRRRACGSTAAPSRTSAT